jgi:hypothetical protein
VQVQDCFAELLGWVVEQWRGEHHLALALDASTLGNRFTVLSVSVVYRGRIPPRIILPVNKKMRTKNVRWGKIIRGGMRTGQGKSFSEF